MNAKLHDGVPIRYTCTYANPRLPAPPLVCLSLSTACPFWISKNAGLEPVKYKGVSKRLACLHVQDGAVLSHNLSLAYSYSGAEAEVRSGKVNCKRGKNEVDTEFLNVPDFGGCWENDSYVCVSLINVLAPRPSPKCHITPITSVLRHVTGR